MDIRCEGCGATPTPAQKLCRFCGTEFDYSLLEIAEEITVETTEAQNPAKDEEQVENVDESTKALQDQMPTEETDTKVVSIRESGQYPDQPQPEKGIFKNLFKKK